MFSDSLSFASHVIIFTETWLKPEILNSDIFPGKYTIYRHDRPSRRGGVVLIAADSTLTSEEILVEEFYNIEFIFVRLPGSLMYITCSYIPPASEFPECLNHLFAIQPVSKNLRF